MTLTFPNTFRQHNSETKQTITNILTSADCISILKIKSKYILSTTLALVYVQAKKAKNPHDILCECPQVHNVKNKNTGCLEETKTKQHWLPSFQFTESLGPTCNNFHPKLRRQNTPHPLQHDTKIETMTHGLKKVQNSLLYYDSFALC